MRKQTMRAAIAFLLLFYAPAQATAQQNEGEPRYGGSLTVSSMYPRISALSWDPADWNWKVNVDAGPYMEQLLAGDLSKGTRGGGKWGFDAEAWVPDSVMRGELLESWRLIDAPLSIDMKIRRGVKFQAREGVMQPREFTADDIVYSFNRLRAAPKANKSYLDFVDRVEAKGKYEVVFYLKRYHVEWPMRIGYGFYSAIVPQEVAEAPNGGATNWRNASGTGPFKLTDFKQGNSGTYTKNPDYWDGEKIGGKTFKLPLVDQLTIQTIGDAQTRLAAFRTGKIDVLLSASPREMDLLKPILDKVRYVEHPDPTNSGLAFRMDQKPFDDIRVRRALNMAVDKPAIAKSIYAGRATLLNVPMGANWGDYYTPIEQMPAEVKELFEYNPKRAKELLAEAGYPNGFEFKMQMATSTPERIEVAQLVAAYLSRIGVKMQIETLEYGAYLSLMTTGKHGPGYWYGAGLSNPTASLEKLFKTNSLWNVFRFNDPKFDQELAAIQGERDEASRRDRIKALTKSVLSQAPMLIVPMPSEFTVWWPWVKNYEGEQRVGAVRSAPIWARVWIDESLKKKSGF